MMNSGQTPASHRFAALWALTVARLREFYRVPEAVFWVYGFPLIMTVALGIAFRSRPVESVTVDVQGGAGAAEVLSTLRKDSRFDVHEYSEEEARLRLKRGRTDMVVEVVHGGGEKRKLHYWFDPSRAGSVAARNLTDSVLVRSESPDAVAAEDRAFEQPGSRYIDWLIPGLLGMNLMGGGIFGVGFVIVDLRVRKLLKRFLATPMRRGDFLLSLGLSRLLFGVPEVLTILVFAWLVFGVGIHGSVLALIAVIVLGGAAFAGIGLLVASRVKTIEGASGLMNLVMLPMWILSGVFFSSERFPTEVQPFIQVLPLTALNNALRGVMLDGASLFALRDEVLILAGWGTISYFIALRYFRWL